MSYTITTDTMLLTTLQFIDMEVVVIHDMMT